MKKIFTLFAAIFMAVGMFAQDAPLYTADAETSPYEEWATGYDGVFPSISGIKVEGYDGYLIIRGVAGVAGYDLMVEFDEEDNVTSLTPIKDGVEGTAVSKGYCTVYTGLEDADNKYLQVYLAQEYCYAGSDASDKSGYVLLSGYNSKQNEKGYGDLIYYYLSWGEEEGGSAEAEYWCATKAVTGEDGTVSYVAIDDYANLGTEGAASIVKIEGAHFTGEHVSGPVAGYKDGELKEDGTLDYDVNNGWDGPKTQPLSKDGSVAPLIYMQGKGNPVNLSLVTFEEITTDGEGTGRYRANWDAAYYLADGSTDGPQNGTYVSVTPTVDGTFTVGVWVNKGNRNLYVCDNIDYKAKAYGTDVKVEGYIQATTWTDEETMDENLIGYMKWVEIPTKAAMALEADPAATPAEGDYFILGPGGRPVWAWLTFEAKKDITYYVFNHNTQVGLMDVTFVPVAGEDTGIASVAAARPTNNAVYNLAGQKVGADFKGIVIKNGKKVMVK